MFNIFKKNEKPQSKLASFSAKNLDLNEAELKKVLGGGGGSSATNSSSTSGTGTGTGDSDSTGRKSGAIMTADYN